MHNSMSRITIFVFFILVFSIGACSNQVGNISRRGTQLEDQEQYFLAAETYLMVLRLDPRNRKARADLTRIIDQAIAEKLFSATELEADLRLDEAIAEIDTARRLLAQSASFNIKGELTSVVESRRLQLVNRRVQILLMEAKRAREEELWSAALAHLQHVETLSPGFGEAKEKMREVWVAWADTNVREGRLRAAAERLEEAARIPGERSGVASARAAAIRSELGLSELRHGACRAAVADLRAAEGLAPGSIDPDALEQAIACAGTCVHLNVTVDPASGLGENQHGLLSTEVRRQVASGVSEFLLLWDLGTRQPRGCDRRLVPGIDGQPMSVGPYSVSVQTTAFSIIREPASSTRQARSQHSFHGESIVTYQEYVEVLSGTMSGWVTVNDLQSGSASLPLPLKVTGETRSRWQGNVAWSSTNRGSQWSNNRASQGSTSVIIGGSGLARVRADDARRQARADLTTRLVQRFATEAARLLLSVVDAEPGVPDPTELPDEAMH